MLGTGCSGSGYGPRTTSATAKIKGQYMDGRHLTDAGNTTPEAALETSFWASSKGDYGADVAFYTPQMQEQVRRWDGNKTEFASKMKCKFSRFKGLQIIARKAVANDTVELRYAFAFASQRTNPENVPMEKIACLVKIQGAWKCAETRSYSADWDAGSTPEPM